MKKLKHVPLAAFAAALALAVAGCGGNGDDGAGGAAAPAGTAETTGMTGMNHGGTKGIESPAADLRITLGRLLGEHALLAQFATQKGLAGAKDFESIAGALDANSVELADAIGSVYGDEARKEFLDGENKWRAHIGFFVDYTVALAKRDERGQKRAVSNLQSYVGEFSSFLAEATGAPQQGFADATTEHVTQLKAQIDLWSQGKFPRSYRTLREGYAHMFMTGDALSGAIAEQQGLDAGGVTQSASDLRLTLGRLLGEHTILAIVATQKGFDGEKDFKPIAGALDANSVELADAIGSVYGDEARKEFLDGENKWRAHIGFFVDYTVALAEKDQKAQKRAVSNLQSYVGEFSRFLSEATGLPQGALADSITEHVEGLKGQIDAYAAGDYEEAYRLTREAYAHMWMTGDTLAGAIVEGNADSFSE